MFSWRAFLIAVLISGLLAFAAMKWFGVSFWVAFVMVALAMLANGWIAYSEDKRPGGFDNPKSPNDEGSAQVTIPNAYQHYLFDLGLLFKEEALETHRKLNEMAVDSSERDFQSGRQLAYYEVITTMQQQAQGFNIPLSDLRLDDIDPDHDLLS